MTERRKFLRFSARDISVEYLIRNEKEVCGSSLANDLSKEGMRFSVHRKLDRGTLVNIKFLLPGETRPVFLTGEVVWTNLLEEQTDPGYAVGVKFFNMDNLDRVRLLDHAYSAWLQTSTASSKPGPGLIGQ